ncbi:MAG: HAMP domain-containing protein, partial [Nitrospiria bacterium]
MALSLRIQLCLVLVSFALLSTATVGGLAYYSGSQLVKRDAGRAVETAALVREVELISLLTRQRDAAAQFLLTLRSICLPRDPACMRGELSQFMAIQRAEAVGIVRPGLGTVVIGALDREPLDPRALVHFSGDNPLRSYRIAVQPSEGERLTVQYPMALVAPIFENRFGLGDSGEAFLINRRGRFVTPTRDPNRSDTDPSDRGTRQCLEGRSGTVWDPDYHATPVIHGFRPLGVGPDACIMTHITKAEAVAPILQLRTRVLGLSGLFAVLAVACSLALGRAYTRPLARLTERARSLQAGDVEREFPAEGPVEVRTLARTFTVMAASLTDAFAARAGLLERERAARLQAESARIRTAVLSDASEILGESLHDDRALDRVARLAASHLGDWCTIDVVEEGTLRRRGAAHADPERYDVDHVSRRLMAALAVYPSAETVQSLEPRIAHLSTDGLEGWSCLLVPIRARDRTWGLITLASGTRRYDEADLSLVEDVAHRTSLAVETAWLYREVQQGRARLEAVLHQMPAGVV